MFRSLGLLAGRRKSSDLARHSKTGSIVALLLMWGYLAFLCFDAHLWIWPAEQPGLPLEISHQYLSGLPVKVTSLPSTSSINLSRQCRLSCPQPKSDAELHSYEWCNSLDWDAPLLEKICENSPHVCAGNDRNVEDAQLSYNYISPIGRFRLVVHYQYFEDAAQQAECEVTNKRTNLEYFINEAVLGSPETVQIHFAYSGKLPTADEYFQSMGMRKERDEIFPRLPNVFYEEVAISRTDLCAHGRFLTQHHRDHTGPGHYFLLLNDGVRGPSVSHGYKKAAKEAGLHEYGVPAWFVPFLSKYAANPQVLLVSTMLSTELEGHLQSYTLSLPSRATLAVGAIMEATCPTNIEKNTAIWTGELGVSSSMLKRGYSIASLWPRINNFTWAHSQCSTALDSEIDILRQWKNPRSLTCYPTQESYVDIADGHCKDRVLLGYHLLNERKNPSTQFSGHWDNVVFIKFGGEVFRQGLLNRDLKEQVKIKTQSVLGLTNNRIQCNGY